MASLLMEGLPAEHVELFQKSDKNIMAFQTTVAKMLTDEQLGSLPEKAQKKMKMLAEKKGGKKKMKEEG